MATARTTRWLLAFACLGLTACGNEDDDDDTAEGTVTQVRAGEGLTGGGTGSIIDLAVDFTKVARAMHTHAVAFADLTGVPNASTVGAKCPMGQKAVGIDVSMGKVSCEMDAAAFSPWQPVTGAPDDIRFNGRVGIGTDPNSTLEIRGVNGQIFVHDEDGGNGASLILDDDDTDATTTANIILQRARGTDTEATIFLGSDNALAYQTTDGPHRFKIGGGEAMRIANNLNVGIANPAPTDLLVVSNAHCDGNSWINASSRAFKENINAFVEDDYRTIRRWLDETEVVWYRYRGDQDPRARVGLIAEDVPAVLATADRKGISTADAIGFLTAAAKEAATENDQLRAENRRLADRLAAMEARLAKLERRR